MKKKIVLLIAACALCMMPASAAAEGAAGGFSWGTAWLTGGGQTLAAPLAQRTAAQADGLVCSTVSVLVSAQEKGGTTAGRLGATDEPAHTGIFCVPGYIVYTTTLNYRVIERQGQPRQYDLISFRIDREVETMAPFERLYKAEARVSQAGAAVKGSSSVVLPDQMADYPEIEYGVTYSVPDEWELAAPLSEQAPVGVLYRVPIDWAFREDYVLEYLHRAT